MEGVRASYDEKLRAWLRTPWDLEWSRKDGGYPDRWQAAIDVLLRGDQARWEEVSGRTERVTVWHPLSGEELVTADVDVDLFRRVSLEVIGRELQAKDSKATLLRLWRRGDELLREGLKAAGVEVPQLWCRELSVWRKSAEESAKTGAGANKAFVSFRVGGAQDYVDQARTTEDFWAGSYLLSWLTWRAAERVVEEWGPDCVVFPALKGQPLMDRWLGEPVESGSDRVASFPNGILAVLPLEEAGRVAKKMEAAFHGAWKTVAETVREELEGKLWKEERSRPGWWEALWKRQSEGERAPFEVFWTVTEWREGEAYGAAYRRASMAMESRKMLRDFEQEEEPPPTCHQCGMREALGKEFWDGLTERKIRAGLRTRFRANERLCTVCVTRRLAQKLYLAEQQRLSESVRFPSTSSVAATEFLKRLIENEDAELTGKLKEFLADWLALTTDGPLGEQDIHLSPWPKLEAKATGAWWKDLLRIDGSWWREEAYDLKRLEKEYASGRERTDVERRDLQQKAKAVQTALKAVLDWAKERKIAGPQNYIALIAGDGDKVGAWLRGDEEAWGKRVKVEMATHLALSECVGGLAKQIAEEAIGEVGNGEAVFGGGDDLLAVVPVTNVAKVVDSYGRLFSAESRNDVLMGGKKFTVSAAALLMHVHDPLAGAVKEVRRLVRTEVKEGIGREGGVLGLRRQSGQQTVGLAKWRTGGFAQVQELVEAIRGGASPRFIAQAVELGPGLEGIEEMKGLQEMAVSLSGVKLRAAMERLVVGGMAVAQQKKQPGGGWDEFTKLLLMARFLARGGLS